jgi:hypothetical protein
VLRHLFVSAFLVATMTLPALAQSSPQGLYLMTRFWSGSLEIDAYHFTSDAAVRAPEYDIETFGLDFARQVTPQNVGDLEISGSVLIITWPDGTVDEAEIEPGSDDCFYWNGGLYCPVDPYTGTTLSGTYEGGATASGGGGYVGSSRTIQFSPDGTYTMSAVGSLSSTGDGVGADAWSAGGETGTYQMAANGISFYPEGGQPWSVSSFPYHDEDGGGEFPNRIYFGGLMLSRE